MTRQPLVELITNVVIDHEDAEAVRDHVLAASAELVGSSPRKRLGSCMLARLLVDLAEGLSALSVESIAGRAWRVAITAHGGALSREPSLTIVTTAITNIVSKLSVGTDPLAQMRVVLWLLAVAVAPEGRPCEAADQAAIHLTRAAAAGTSPS